MFVEFNDSSFDLGRITSITKIKAGKKTKITLNRAGNHGFIDYTDDLSINDIFKTLGTIKTFPLVKFHNHIINADHIRYIKLDGTDLKYLFDVVDIEFNIIPNCTKADQRELQRLLNEAMGYKPEHRQLIATRQKLTG